MRFALPIHKILGVRALITWQLTDTTRYLKYLKSVDQPWLERFIRRGRWTPARTKMKPTAPPPSPLFPTSPQLPIYSEFRTTVQGQELSSSSWNYFTEDIMGWFMLWQLMFYSACYTRECYRYNRCSSLSPPSAAATSSHIRLMRAVDSMYATLPSPQSQAVPLHVALVYNHIYIILLNSV